MYMHKRENIFVPLLQPQKERRSQIGKLNLDTLCVNTSELLLIWQITTLMPWMINMHLELFHNFVACNPRVSQLGCVCQELIEVLLFHLKIEEINSINEKNQGSPKLYELIM